MTELSEILNYLPRQVARPPLILGRDHRTSHPKNTDFSKRIDDYDENKAIDDFYISNDYLVQGQ
ncbi:uncharacterized protein RSE6_05931 [Rhynchosporium secalis]|uniref:Uncharacterized protein n=1 Tax=Rhynchosporium secalis TaxID=38038 RepID=A0A1E1M944_RHYSE|nr:uncharacterized protein RSE6_05931 [Rhynchosporium secalis]